MASRSAENTTRIVSPSDEQLLKFTSKIVSDFSAERIQVFIDGVSIFDKNNPVDSDIAELLDVNFGGYKLADLIKGRKKIINRIVLQLPYEARCEFHRSVSVWDAGTYRSIPSQHEAEILTVQVQHARETFILPALKVRIFESFPSAKSATSTPSTSVQAIEREVSELSEVSRRIAEQLAETLLEQEKRFEAHRAELDQEDQLRREKFEQEASRRFQEIEELKAKVLGREKALDDSQARHARRALRRQITDNLKSRLANGVVSRGSIVNRVVVTGITAIGAGFAIWQTFQGLAATDVAESEISSAPFIFGAVRASIGGALFAFLLFYILSYWRKKQKEDEDFERLLERYSLDIDRASWVVETVIEVRSEDREKDVPDAWLAGVTSNLFPYSASTDHDDEPTALDALGELLKKGARFSVGTNGAEMELTPSAAKRIGRSGN